MAEPKIKKKKNLVLARVGDYSLHHHWLEGCAGVADRNWDLLISCFGEEPEKWRRDDVEQIYYKGGKFDGLYDAFQQRPELLDQYENIMMTDDDFFMDYKTINRFFEIVEEYDLQVAQPTLTHDSFFVYFSELQNPNFKLRWTNFGEAITICLHSKVWRQILPLYERNPMALFIDNFWSRLTDDPQTQVALVDETPFTHTRPTGGDLWTTYYGAGKGEVGYAQWTTLDHRPNRDKWFLRKIVTHAGVLKNGRRVLGRWRLLPHLLSGWRRVAKGLRRVQTERERRPSLVLRREIKNHLTGEIAPPKTHLIIHGIPTEQ